MSEQKPMIRHCYNCKWCEYKSGVLCPVKYCTVKYKTVGNGRKEALLCRYFQKKEVQE